MRLVLRWSGEGTYEAHKAILDRQGHVWWGWWQKKGEPSALDLRRQFRAALDTGPQEIGLVSRKENKFLVGRCEDLVFVDDGEHESADPERFISPEPNYTPEYYRESPVSAYFKFTGLRFVEFEEYRREYGDVPVGDSTIFEVREEDDELRAFPRPQWNLAARRMRGAAILHVSDLHFGGAHAYPVRHGDMAVRHPTLSERVCQAVEQLGSTVGVVAVTGDLITAPDYGALADFEQFMDDLTEHLGLSRQDVVIIPGNHDFDIVTDPVKMKVDYKHEWHFKQFLRGFYQTPLPDLERVSRHGTPDGRDVVLFALNSARLSTSRDKDYGYVGSHRYESMLNWTLQQLQDERSSALLVALLHHHVMPVTPISDPRGDRHVSLTVDAGELCSNLQAAGVSLLLHGHQHLPFVGRLDRILVGDQQADLSKPASNSGLLVLGCGSSGVTADRLDLALPFNTLGLYDVGLDSIRVRMSRFNVSVAPQTFVDFEWEC